jgi:hypothetical protein
MKSTITGEPSMTGWHHATAFMAVVALLLDAHTGVWAQGSNNRTNTFEQRFPPDQVPTPPAGEQPPTQPPVRQAPTQPPADQVRARPNPLRQTGQDSSPGGEQPKKLATVTTAQRVARARRSRSRLVVAPLRERLLYFRDRTVRQGQRSAAVIRK